MAFVKPVMRKPLGGTGRGKEGHALGVRNPVVRIRVFFSIVVSFSYKAAIL